MLSEHSAFVRNSTKNLGKNQKKTKMVKEDFFSEEEDFEDLGSTSARSPEKPFSGSFRAKREKSKGERIGHEEIYNLITGDEISWQTIIYDLVRSEQLDPLDIDIIFLTRGFLEKVRKLEEANFFISGKVLLAASILLRMKADRVFNQLQYLDELLNGKPEEQELVEAERYFIPPGELPLILPKTPLPRLKRVTMEELMGALRKAIEVEERRHRRFELLFDAERDAAVMLPVKPINITARIKELYDQIKEHFAKHAHESDAGLTFANLLPSEKREDKIATFIPLLHLDTREKITLEQQEAFGEIYISLFKKFSEQLQELGQEIEQLELTESEGGWEMPTEEEKFAP